MKNMNKKFAVLLIPLMLFPLIAFGYAHFTDQVIKKYKIHVGSVILEVQAFHVDYAKVADVDNDGVIFGDELNVTIYESDDCRWYVEISADPVPGGFKLVTSMIMHNAGKLPFTLTWFLGWDGPYDDDPCYVIPPAKDFPLPAPWQYSMTVEKWNQTHGWTGPYGTTQTHYKPSNLIRVNQTIEFPQPAPGSPYQKEWQCKWIKLWVTFFAEDIYEEISSYDGEWR